jgi:hypothetical protein
MLNLRRIRWARHIARTGEKRNAYRFSGGKARRKETTSRREDYIKMDLI